MASIQADTDTNPAGESENASSEPASPASADEKGESSPQTANSGESSSRGWLSRLFGSRNGNGGIRDDLADALKVSTGEDSDFTAGEKVMLRNILLLQDVRIEDIMVPRAEMIAVEQEIPLGELLAIFEDSGHSRLPVYNETLDDPKGMVHIRDVMAYMTKNSLRTKRANTASGKHSYDLSKVDLSRQLNKLNLMRKVLFVPPSMLAADLMARMQASRIQMALVIDEYGGTDGLVSLEDIVEIIVGDIEDEHDDDESLIRKMANGSLRCDARAEIDDIREMLESDFSIGDIEEEADTIGGVIFSLIGRIPVKGEVIEAFGYEFRIVDADPRRIKQIEMMPSKIAAKRVQSGN